MKRRQVSLDFLRLVSRCCESYAVHVCIQAPPHSLLNISCTQTYVLQVLIDGLDTPTDLDVAPDGSDLLLVAQQDGIIYAVSGSAAAKDEDGVEKWVIAELADLICYNVERGLVGISFHPDFTIDATEGDDSMWIYTFYTSNRNGPCATGKWVWPSPKGTTNVLSRFRIISDSSSGRIQLDMESEEILLETAVQPKYIHNGGDIGFGSDGLLYLTWGDGSTSKLRNDQGLPFQQSLDVLFGKIVRLTPEGNSKCTIEEQEFSLLVMQSTLLSLQRHNSHPFRINFDTYVFVVVQSPTTTRTLLPTDMTKPCSAVRVAASAVARTSRVLRSILPVFGIPSASRLTPRIPEKTANLVFSSMTWERAHTSAF